MMLLQLNIICEAYPLGLITHYSFALNS